ncbi:hypothetical protein DHEL01_v209070 [Diaporthe helianthi]|uniref:Uncharacterized protein n=1 Tax=Diaporthe helianthi TaxID=158607 RepID=A0A2P5HQN9_DIAHE|nr:hypothetical protein DHEL01_v209070 [Diaporthe helianthi]
MVRPSCGLGDLIALQNRISLKGKRNHRVQSSAKRQPDHNLIQGPGRGSTAENRHEWAEAEELEVVRLYANVQVKRHQGKVVYRAALSTTSSLPFHPSTHHMDRCNSPLWSGQGIADLVQCLGNQQPATSNQMHISYSVVELWHPGDYGAIAAVDLSEPRVGGTRNTPRHFAPGCLGTFTVPQSSMVAHQELGSRADRLVAPLWLARRLPSPVSRLPPTVSAAGHTHPVHMSTCPPNTPPIDLDSQRRARQIFTGM